MSNIKGLVVQMKGSQIVAAIGRKVELLEAKQQQLNQHREMVKRQLAQMPVPLYGGGLGVPPLGYETLGHDRDMNVINTLGYRVAGLKALGDAIDKTASYELDRQDLIALDFLDFTVNMPGGFVGGDC